MHALLDAVDTSVSAAGAGGSGGMAASADARPAATGMLWPSACCNVWRERGEGRRMGRCDWLREAARVHMRGACVDTEQRTLLRAPRGSARAERRRRHNRAARARGGRESAGGVKRLCGQASARRRRGRRRGLAAQELLQVPAERQAGVAPANLLGRQQGQLQAVGTAREARQAGDGPL
jgi:hypothetical protein